MTKSQISAATGAGELADHDLHELGTLAHDGNSVPHLAMQRLVREVLRLKHELANPQFMYAGGRVSRDAILCRNATIDKQMDDLAEMRARLAQAAPAALDEAAK